MHVYAYSVVYHDAFFIPGMSPRSEFWRNRN